MDLFTFIAGGAEIFTVHYLMVFTRSATHLTVTPTGISGNISKAIRNTLTSTGPSKCRRQGLLKITLSVR